MKNEINKFKNFLESNLKNDTDWKYTIISNHKNITNQIITKEVFFNVLLQWFEFPEYIKNCSFNSKRMLINETLYTIIKD